MTNIVTFWMTSNKSILAIIVISLILGFSAHGEETSAPLTKPVEIPESISSPNELSERIKQLVKSLEYPDEVAEDFARMVMGWEGSRKRPALAGWEERLANAHQKLKESKISQKDVAKIEARILQELCTKIRKQFKSQKLVFELSDVIQSRKANCVGYSQLTYIAGNAIGLSVRPINVLDRYPPQMDDPNEGHIACIVDLSDGRFVMADVAMFFDKTSNAFTLEKHFVKVGSNWELRNKTNPLRIHPRIQLSDRNVLISAIYNNRGVVFTKKGEHESAISNYNKAIEIAPELTIAYKNRGITYLSKGMLDRALLDYSKALEIDPKDVNAYINRGFVYQITAKYDWATFEYNKAIEIDPEFAKAYLYRGLAHQSKGQFDQAILDYTRAIEIDPQNVLAYQSRGTVYIHLSKNEEANKDLLKALKLDPKLKESVKKISERYELNLKLD